MVPTRSGSGRWAFSVDGGVAAPEFSAPLQRRDARCCHMRALHWCLWTRKRLLAILGALLLLVVIASHL